MENAHGKLYNFALLFFRTGLGLAYIFIHGGPKITGGPERWEKVGSAVSYFGVDIFHGFWGLIAAITEFGGVILILLGLYFRPALSLMILTMFVAAYQLLSRGEGIMRAAYPLEMAVALITMLMLGPGKYSLQNYLRSRKNKNGTQKDNEPI